MRKKHSLVKGKLLFTILIILVYLIGRSLPLFGIDTSEYKGNIDAEMTLLQSISGDTYSMSIFAIGLGPYMIATLVSQLYLAIKSASSKMGISPKRANRVALVLTMILAAFQAVIHLNDLTFTVTGDYLIIAKVVAVIQMLTGVVVILWLCERNKLYGIGGQTAIIYVNIIDSIRTTISGSTLSELRLPLIIGVILIVVMLIMENTELRIPVMRISIHNIHADKNYMAIKLNPIGVMPVMFAMAFFMLPQFAVKGMLIFYPDNESLISLSQQLTLTHSLGIKVYIAIVYILTIGFSFIFLNPRDLAENFSRSGDCIPGLQAGRDTRWYLGRKIFIFSVISATVMSLSLGLPLYLQYKGILASDLVMLPSTIMMLTGIWSSLYQEMRAVDSLDSYRPFI